MPKIAHALVGMTEQQVFDKVYLGLSARGFTRALECKDGACAYRGEVGPCAAGFLITNEEYALHRSKIEYTAWKELVDNSLAPAAHYSLVCSLQSAHDDGNTDMKAQLEKVARSYNLKVPNE